MIDSVLIPLVESTYFKILVFDASKKAVSRFQDLLVYA